MSVPNPLQIPNWVTGLAGDFPMGYRFAVFFLIGGILPNPIDIRFQKVRGLSVSIATTSVREGGQNLYAHKLPTGVESGTLTLERGMVVGSLLNVEFNATLSSFKFFPCNVMVMLLSESKIPLAAWMFTKAYPIKWSTSDLDAEQKSIVIDTMELAYTRMQILRI